MSINRIWKMLASDAKPGVASVHSGELCVLRFLADRINARGNDPVCFWSQGRIGNYFGWNADSVGRLLRSLEKQGFIEIERRKGRSSVYRLLDRDGVLHQYAEKANKNGFAASAGSLRSRSLIDDLTDRSWAE